MKDERQRRVKCNYSSTIHVERINIKEKKKEREISITTIHDYLSKLWMTLMLSLYDAIQDHQVNLQIWFFCILFSAILAWNQSTGFVYAYYVLRMVSFILSQGSIFCIAIAYSVSVIPQWLIIMNREYWGSHFPIFCRRMLLKRIRGQQLLVG